MAASVAPVVTSAPASSSLTQSEEDALKVAVFQRLHPRAYLERFLAENIRPDKRLCDGFRDVHVNVGEFRDWGGRKQPPPFFFLTVLMMFCDEEVRFYLNCQWVCTCSNGKYYNRMWSQSWDFRTWTRSWRRWLLGYSFFIIIIIDWDLLKK